MPHQQTIVCATPLGHWAIELSSCGIYRLGVTTDPVTAAPVTAASTLYQQQLINYLNGKTQHIDLPLDVHGTPFQKTVWAALQNILYGTTITYAQLAVRIGQPTAVRAVARACAANPIALAIPCHRVIRTDGHLGGYRWGLPLKQQLLTLEHTTIQEAAA